MPGYMQKSLQYPFVRYAFLPDDIHQLSAKSLVPVCIFKCSHNLGWPIPEGRAESCKITCCKKYLPDTFFGCNFSAALSLPFNTNT